jgi:hypothetical protein
LARHKEDAPQDGAHAGGPSRAKSGPGQKTPRQPPGPLGIKTFFII